jgi:MinD-like ATPase involved in chromosome partitioning or flagellar assembly
MGTRVIGVVAGRGGVGTTTTAIGLALALAAGRDEPVVLMDVRAGTQPLSTRLGAPPAPRLVDVANDPWGAAAAATTDGLRLVDGADWRAPADAVAVADALGVLTATYGFVVVDMGTDLSDKTVPVVTGSDLVVVVVGPGRDAISTAQQVTVSIAAATRPAEPALVVALVARTRDRISRLEPDRGDGVVVVPYDRGLAGGGAIRRDALGPATWQAYLMLAEYVDDGRSAR